MSWVSQGRGFAAAEAGTARCLQGAAAVSTNQTDIFSLPERICANPVSEKPGNRVDEPTKKEAQSTTVSDMHFDKCEYYAMDSLHPAFNQLLLDLLLILF